MIKNITQIGNKPVSFIKEFINNCTIEEKIDTHYVIVEITSKQTITIKKATGKVVDRVDMILNSMWSQLVTDWNFIKLNDINLFGYDNFLTNLLNEGKYTYDEIMKVVAYVATRIMKNNYLDENNMASIDWNALNADAEGRKKNAQELADYAIKTSEGKDIVVLLMHDTYGKEETAKALPTIIKYFKDNGYEFKTLS